MYTVSQKKLCKIVFVRTCQISTNSDNFWQKDGKEAKIMRDALIFSPNFRHHTTVLNADVPNVTQRCNYWY